MNLRDESVVVIANNGDINMGRQMTYNSVERIHINSRIVHKMPNMDISTVRSAACQIDVFIYFFGYIENT